MRPVRGVSSKLPSSLDLLSSHYSGILGLPNPLSALNCVLTDFSSKINQYTCNIINSLYCFQLLEIFSYLSRPVSKQPLAFRELSITDN